MNRWSEQPIWGWGRYPRTRAQCARPERRSEVLDAVNDRDGAPVLAYGLGRSYGDAALLSDGKMILTQRLDRMLGFDPESGWLRCEAGVTVQDILETFVPRGFFPPVTPGTQFVTVGGALACDVHGKNHHVDGCWSDHVRNVEVLTASGDVVMCDATQEPDLFWATVGGNGLTGLILAMDVCLTPIETPFIEMESIRVENLDHFFEVSRESGDYTHTVSWIDCVARGHRMGRGIFMRGRHATAAVAGDRTPPGALTKMLGPLLDFRVDGPSWLLNKTSIALLNEAYFRKQLRPIQRSVVHYGPFFYPLDVVQNWNRVYGKRGFLQYQLVVPPDPEHRAIRCVLDQISGSGMASFLAVVKEFGDRRHGGLSFPEPGVTLALDLPNFGAPLFELLDRLDAVVVEAGGRVYLCKDARLSRQRFRQMYPDWPRWKEVRDHWDPQGVFQSDQARRLGLVDG